MVLAQEIEVMNVDPKLEAIAMKVMDKMDLSNKSDKYGNIIVVIMVIGIILSLIRVIQECNNKQFGILNKEQKAKRMQEQVKSICISRNFLNKWRLRRIIKDKLSSEDYNLYGAKLRDAILDTGVDLTEDESYTLVEAANV
jgi:hypothetical protein